MTGNPPAHSTSRVRERGLWITEVAMRYQEFRDRLQDALREAGLIQFGDIYPTETVDISTMERRWSVVIGYAFRQAAEPFYVSGKVSFRWSPFDAARSYTCEEDLLTELYDRGGHSTDTVPRLVRVDIALYARLPYGSTTPMPAPEIWKSWSETADEKLDLFLPRQDSRHERRLLPEVRGGRSHSEVEARCAEEGVLILEGVSVSAFRLVPVPRMWDDPDKREREEDGGEQLDETVQLFKAAMGKWTAVVAELARWIRYGPPSPERESMEDPFADVEDDEPETIH